MTVDRWRVGRKVGRTIYLDDKLVGVMDTPELAEEVVVALNGYTYATEEAERYHQESRDSAKIVGGMIRILRENGIPVNWETATTTVKGLTDSDEPAHPAPGNQPRSPRPRRQQFDGHPCSGTCQGC